MSKTIKQALLFSAVFSGLLGVIIGMTLQEHECKSHNYPSDMRFYMYCETCAECGYGEKEVEYSIVSNVGYSGCPQCDSHYVFELDNKGNKVIIKGE